MRVTMSVKLLLNSLQSIWFPLYFKPGCRDFVKFCVVSRSRLFADKLSSSTVNWRILTFLYEYCCQKCSLSFLITGTKRTGSNQENHPQTKCSITLVSTIEEGISVVPQQSILSFMSHISSTRLACDNLAPFRVTLIFLFLFSTIISYTLSMCVVLFLLCFHICQLHCAFMD